MNNVDTQSNASSMAPNRIRPRPIQDPFWRQTIDHDLHATSEELFLQMHLLAAGNRKDRMRDYKHQQLLDLLERHKRRNYRRIIAEIDNDCEEIVFEKDDELTENEVEDDLMVAVVTDDEEEEEKGIEDDEFLEEEPAPIEDELGKIFLKKHLFAREKRKERIREAHRQKLLKRRNRGKEPPETNSNKRIRKRRRKIRRRLIRRRIIRRRKRPDGTLVGEPEEFVEEVVEEIPLDSEEFETKAHFDSNPGQEIDSSVSPAEDDDYEEIVFENDDEMIEEVIDDSDVFEDDELEEVFEDHEFLDNEHEVTQDSQGNLFIVTDSDFNIDHDERFIDDSDDEIQLFDEYDEEYFDDEEQFFARVRADEGSEKGIRQNPKEAEDFHPDTALLPSASNSEKKELTQTENAGNLHVTENANDPFAALNAMLQSRIAEMSTMAMKKTSLKAKPRKSMEENLLEKPIGYKAPTLLALVNQARTELRPPPSEEHKKEYVPVVVDAASLGRMQRLDEKVIEAQGTGDMTSKTDSSYNQWASRHAKRGKNRKPVSTASRSNAQIMVNEAAAVGKLMKRRVTQDVDLHSPRAKTVDIDDLGDSNHEGAKVFRTRHLIDRHINANRENIDWTPEYNFDGFENLDDVELPTENLPPFRPPKTKKTIPEIREELSRAVAEGYWERYYRLERPGAKLNVTPGCYCKYCFSANAWQTFAYQKKWADERLQHLSDVDNDPDPQKIGYISRLYVPEKSQHEAIDLIEMQRPNDSEANRQDSEPLATDGTSSVDFSFDRLQLDRIDESDDNFGVDMSADIKNSLTGQFGQAQQESDKPLPRSIEALAQQESTQTKNQKDGDAPTQAGQRKKRRFRPLKWMRKMMGRSSQSLRATSSSDAPGRGSISTSEKNPPVWGEFPSVPPNMVHTKGAVDVEEEVMEANHESPEIDRQYDDGGEEKISAARTDDSSDHDGVSSSKENSSFVRQIPNVQPNMVDTKDNVDVVGEVIETNHQSPETERQCAEASTEHISAKAEVTDPVELNTHDRLNIESEVDIGKQHHADLESPKLNPFVTAPCSNPLSAIAADTDKLELNSSGEVTEDTKASSIDLPRSELKFKLNTLAMLKAKGLKLPSGIRV